MASFRIDSGDYMMTWSTGPDAYERKRPDAMAIEEVGQVVTAEQVATLTVRKAPGSRPLLLIVAAHDPRYDGDQIRLQALLVPETHILFVGSQDEIFAYDLRGPARLWRERAESGFWEWQRHGDLVLLAAELELAAWDIYGLKQWETFVEPPYDYTVAGDTVHLTVMGVPTSFPLASGPSWSGSLPWSGH